MLLHLNPLTKPNPSMFNSLKNCLQLDTLLGWVLLKGWKQATTDQFKQYLSPF